MNPQQLYQDFLRHVAQTSGEPVGLVVARAQGAVVTGADGREYLDFLSGLGVANIGHTHPAVVAAIRAQAKRYLHTMVYGEYALEPQVRLAKRLAGLLPPPLSVTYFTTSGTEAVEGAIKTAMKSTGRTNLVAFAGAYHGGTLGALAAAGNPLYREPYAGRLAKTRLLPFNDAAAIDAIDAIDETVAAVLIEPIQSEAGVRVPDPGYLAAVRRAASRAGALLIFDEVMTGFGRTGSLFAFEQEGVVPDLLVFAKALGGGLPLGSFVGSPTVMATLAHDPPLSHVTTFGGHPLSCAAGLAALDVLIEGKLADRAASLGATLKDRLAALGRKTGILAVRGRGLLVGVDLPDSAAAERVVHRCRKRGLLVSTTLHAWQTIRLAPPLILTDAQLARGLEILADALAAR